MITNEFAEASAEITEILGYLPKEYVEKIPVKLRKFFDKVRKQDYVSNIDPYKLLDEQDLKQKTKTLITILYRNYWCSEEERAELDKILIENDKKYETKLREMYNPDNIFKKKEKEEQIEKAKETSLAVYDNRMWYQKAFEMISKLFKRLFKK